MREFWEALHPNGCLSCCKRVLQHDAFYSYDSTIEQVIRLHAG